MRANLGKIFRYTGAASLTTAGVYFVTNPPQTTLAFLDASWPPRVWGVLMLCGAAVIGVGLLNRVLQVEQYGTLLAAVGAFMLSLTQTLIMIGPPPSPTRGGTVFTLWALTAFTLARYFELSREIKVAREAQELVGD